MMIKTLVLDREEWVEVLSESLIQIDKETTYYRLTIIGLAKNNNAQPPHPVISDGSARIAWNCSEKRMR